MVSILWLLYSHKRRSRPEPNASELSVEPFPSGRGAKTRRSRPISPKLPLVPQPDKSDSGVTVGPLPSGRDAKNRPESRRSSRDPPRLPTPRRESRDIGIEADIRATLPPSADVLPVSDEIIGQARLEIIEGFTTDELVLVLNQRIRWNDDDTLPEYPGSERGRA
ncbi:hypothetical protein V5O48_012491 [Marasmius crinis-equi]|uniref:Uncharacterized protein n=1 Tax=Marasmius crinis-equi TaxID=585013 RepID=A0ABR3F2P7_9AGAR